jgi:PmbA protein
LERLIEELKNKGFEDIAVLEISYNSSMVKFVDNKVTIVQKWSTSSTSLFCGKDKRFFIGEIKGAGNFDPNNIKNIIENLQESPYYPKLTDNQRVIRINSVSKTIEDLIEDPSRAVSLILDNSEYPISGMVQFVKYKRRLATSKGFEGEEERSYIISYVRAFNNDYTGQWAFTSANYSDSYFKVMLNKANTYASITNEVKVDEGTYDVILSPLVVSNFMSYLSWMASAMAVEIGMSIFANLKDLKVANEKFSMLDVPKNQDMPFATSFDDEGTFTYNKAIIENGEFRTLLYNNTLAMKANKKSTGNAGWVYPHSWGIEIKEGKVSEESLTSGNVILFNNNWYTRFQNYYEGIFSTVGRDAIVVYKDGKPLGVARRLRIADSLKNIIRNVEELSVQRYSIMWWDSEVPTLTPYLLVRNVRISKASF